MASPQYLVATIDKFVFRVARDCRYTDADVWARREGDRVRVGVTDFLQQKSGDVAFVNLKQVGTPLQADDELAAIEAIKVDLIIPAPLAGTIVAVNAALGGQPELVNADPYDAGWLAEIEPIHLKDFDTLLEAEAYLPKMAARAEMEGKK